MKATEAQKQELRDGFKESLAAYEAERAERERVGTPPANGDRRATALRDAFLLTGDMAELGFAVAACANEIGEADVTRAVRAVRKATTELGNLLAQKQRRRA